MLYLVGSTIVTQRKMLQSRRSLGRAEPRLLLQWSSFPPFFFFRLGGKAKSSGKSPLSPRAHIWPSRALRGRQSGPRPPGKEPPVWSCAAILSVRLLRSKSQISVPRRRLSEYIVVCCSTAMSLLGAVQRSTTRDRQGPAPIGYVAKGKNSRGQGDPERKAGPSGSSLRPRPHYQRRPERNRCARFHFPFLPSKRDVRIFWRRSSKFDRVPVLLSHVTPPPRSLLTCPQGGTTFVASLGVEAFGPRSFSLA